MATIQQLMPYLEQGYMAVDHVRIGPAYLAPIKQDGSLTFEWKAYEMESEWSGPEIHSREYVCTWESNNWGILCQSREGSEYGEEIPKDIEQAIADGLAYKADGF